MKLYETDEKRFKWLRSESRCSKGISMFLVDESQDWFSWHTRLTSIGRCGNLVLDYYEYSGILPVKMLMSI